MAWRQHLDFSPVAFIKGQGSDKANDLTGPSQGKDSDSKNKGQDGRSVKTFYEELVGLNSETVRPTSNCKQTRQKSAPPNTSRISEKKQEKRKSSPLPHNTSSALRKRPRPHTAQEDVKISFNKFLSAAQTGDIDVVRAATESGLDIDTPDEYGWTALMCAVERNNEEVVRLLLTNGADPWIKDKRGMTSIDIANKRRKPGLVAILQNWLVYRGAQTVQSSSGDWRVKVKLEPYFCSTCNAKFSSEESHVASTVHLFNLKLAPKPTDYQIPVTNVGYKMMLRSGWDAEKGLGPTGGGQKFPVKTKLKRDREGLGGKIRPKAKVTHFNPNDAKAVKHVSHTRHTAVRTERAATQSKKAIKAKARHDQKVEIKFRRDFYD